MMWIDVDTAVVLPVNVAPLTDDTDFKTLEESVAYNAAGMDLIWHFLTTAGVVTEVVVTPTTAGDYDWAHGDGAMYDIEMTATGGASANNDTEGFGYFTGVCDGVLPWTSRTFGFRAAGLNNLIVDNAFSATRGLVGTALPAAVADAAGGLAVSDAGGLDLDTKLGYLTAAVALASVCTEARLAELAAANLPTDIANLPTDADVNAACDTALSDYDAPTKAEMDTAHALLATVAKQDVIDDIVDDILAYTIFDYRHTRNKLIGTDNGDGTITYVLYADDGSTPLLTWVYTTASGTRAAGT